MIGPDFMNDPTGSLRLDFWRFIENAGELA
jgi:hypothetical protein